MQPFLQTQPRWKIFRDIFLFMLTISAIGWFLLSNAENIGYNWQWYAIPRFFGSFSSNGFTAGPLLQGLFVTLKISFYSFFLSFGIGLLTVFMRLSRLSLYRQLAAIYLEAIRNTPLLVQIFFIYFVIAPILNMSAFIAAILALSLF
jgi:polar amino acid transport system permease protein